MRLGVGPGVALVLLFGSLIGSYFNIRSRCFRPPEVGQVVEFFGMRYIVPSSRRLERFSRECGRCRLFNIMSAYLMIRYQFWLKATIAPRPSLSLCISLDAGAGIGIAVPVFARS